MDLIQYLYKRHPEVKHNLYMAHMNISPYKFLKQAFSLSMMMALGVGIIAFFVILKVMSSFALALLALIGSAGIFFFFFLTMQLNVPKIKLMRRGREIDNEILFAARFLLIKLSSGRPLFNALIDTSQSYGVASKYFKEIVDDINFGTTIEKAIDHAINTTPSNNFRKLLFQITTALKVGVDVTQNLEVVIAEIEHEQALQIDKYAKKLSSVALFYMLGAIVVPSLGMTLFTVAASFANISLEGQVGTIIYATILAGNILIQFFFISLFRQIRPSVNL